MENQAAASSSLALLNQLMESFRVVDLSVTLTNHIPKWPTHPSLWIEPAATHERDGYANQFIRIGEHTGTHVDAPFHIHGDLSDKTIDTLAPNAIMGRCTVINLSAREWKPGERASLDDLKRALERQEADVEAGDIVLIHYGWMKYWTPGEHSLYYASNQPGLTEDAADFILSKQIKAIGTDTAAVGTPVIDGQSAGPCYFHEIVLRQGIYLMECLANLDRLPSKCYFIASPLKIAGGSGSPIRAFALVP